ncbi:uncharacterized protein LOC121641350 [Melanotaenia boesemani]|uniref:uncharacterized protein LOC121641350 n=1 Tax=Melanotaenia boesemani TaxID=1250792 RepID=UPI001C048D65|nr:uncharacterized protein LOC121641350 [Melanotaenia boesemani]
MTKDIDKWVSECAMCQSAQRPIKQEVQYTPIKVTQPFELVGMDLIGKLKKTNHGNQYICVMIDYFTKWPQAYAIKTKCADEVTEQILKFVYQFEAPKRILTDQGREFVNAVNKSVCAKLGILRSLCAPYHPQTNGLIENMNSTIQKALCKLVGTRPDTWDEYLDPVMFALRTKKQVTTKYSPYFLMFGREARYPVEIPENYELDSTVEDVVGEENISKAIEEMDDIRKIVLENVSKAQNTTKKRLKSLGKSIDFAVGDMVLRQNIRSQQRKGGKLEANFLGPFTIIALAGKSADLQGENGSVHKKVSIDHLKPFKQCDVRVPQKIVSSVSNVSSSPASAAPHSSPASTTEASAAPHSSPASAAPHSSPASAASHSSPASTTEASAAPHSSPVSAAPHSSPASTTEASAAPHSCPASAASHSSPASAAPHSSPVSAAPHSSPASTTEGSAAPADTCPASSESANENYKETEIAKYVNEVWSGKFQNASVILSKIGPYKLFCWDIARLAPSQELQSEVINAYLTVLIKNHNKKNVDHAAVIDTYEMNRIWTKKTSRLKMEPLHYKFILGIINEHHHWMLTVIHPSEKRSLFLDPLGESHEKTKRCLEATRAFMRKRGCNVSRWVCGTLPHVNQQDGVSCGVFVLKFAECILEGKPLQFDNSTTAMNTVRFQIATTLLKESETLKNLCHHCGFQDTDDPQWIACDNCGRWYHHGCVKSPPLQKKYFCDVCVSFLF